MTPDSATVWIQQARFLWTGRRDGRPVGTIERGRRYTLTDLLGGITRHRTLHAAQTAADQQP